MYDVIIVGGGIVGLSTAYQILADHPGWRVAVIEKESDVSKHQSENNSGVMHSGIYYKPGSLRATNCRRGHQLLTQFCQKHEIPYDLCGKIIVATDAREIDTLQQIFQKGQQNGLEGIKIIAAEEAREIEPHVRCLKAIFVPQAGITSYKRVADTYARLFKASGGVIHLQRKVLDIKEKPSAVEVVTAEETFICRHLITCAGLYADKITRMTIPDCPYQVIPFRGEYYELKPESTHLVNHLIYPVPDVNFPFLGVHFTRRIEGGIEAGPNAVLAFRREGYFNHQLHAGELWETLQYPGFRKLALKYWRTGLQEMRRSFSKIHFVRASQKLVPEITEADVEKGRSGVRAMACDPDGNLIDDFLFLETKRVINVMNAPSPAATASLAIGEEIIHRLTKKITV